MSQIGTKETKMLNDGKYEWKVEITRKSPHPDCFSFMVYQGINEKLDLNYAGSYETLTGVQALARLQSLMFNVVSNRLTILIL